MWKPIRRRATTALAALVCAAVPASAAHADAGAAPVELPGATTTWATVAGVDGRLWTPVEDYTSPRAGVRLDAAARSGPIAWLDVSSADGTPNVEVRSALQPLLDGTVAVVVAYSEYATGGDRHTSDVRLVRVGAAGAVAGAVPLPQPARRASRFLVEPDGTVWWARLCHNEVYRRAPGGRTRLFRLRRIGCSGDPAREQGTQLAAGADGSLWLVNLCTRRVVRVTPSGRVREWRPRDGTCHEREVYFPPVMQASIAVDPRGGVAYGVDGASGRVLPGGRLVENEVDERPGFVGGDGTLWTAGGHRIALDGTVDDTYASGNARHVRRARDGGAWLLENRRHLEGAYKQAFWWYDAARATHVAADGTATAWQLAGATESFAESSRIVGAAVDAAGALVLSREDGDRGHPRPWPLVIKPSMRTQRLTPPGLGAPRAPRATPVRVAGRERRAVTVQLACDADVGRWCAGSVRLAGAAKAARFLVAGQQGAGVRLRLGPRAARRLRRRGRVRATAVVVSEGAGRATRRVVIRRR